MNTSRLASSALPLSPDLGEVLARGDVWRGDALATLPGVTVASGYPALDEELPGGGWPQGQLTEFFSAQAGVGELSLLLPALGRLSAAGGWLALVAPPCLLHAPAWAAAGVALERLLVVRDASLSEAWGATARAHGRASAAQPAARGKAVPAANGMLWALEQLLASGGFAAVLGWCASEPDPRSWRYRCLNAGGVRLDSLWCSIYCIVRGKNRMLWLALNFPLLPLEALSLRNLPPVDHTNASDLTKQSHRT